MTIRNSEKRKCEFCIEFLGENEYHEQFDFYKHPHCKPALRRLRGLLDALPEDERLYGMENLAVKRGFLRNVKIELLSDFYKKPIHGDIVLPGYEMLCGAYKWLGKLEEYDIKIGESQEQAGQTSSTGQEIKQTENLSAPLLPF